MVLKGQRQLFDINNRDDPLRKKNDCVLSFPYDMHTTPLRKNARYDPFSAKSLQLKPYISFLTATAPVP